MGFFNWAAPIFGRVADRWSDEGFERIAAPIRDALDDCECLLDVGGGTGALAARLADALDAHVTVLDPTPEMVSYAPDRDDIDVVIGSAEEMPFDDDGFDAIVITDAFHHFREPDRAADEIHRVVRPGGVVEIVELDPAKWSIKLIALGERVLGEPAHFYEPEAFVALMATHGIQGVCERCGDVEYVFVGRVEASGPPGAAT